MEVLLSAALYKHLCRDLLTVALPAQTVSSGSPGLIESITARSLKSP